MVSSSSAAQPAVLDRLSLLQHLDNCLEEAYQHGSPIWHSPGQGGTQPNRPKHDFSCHNLQSGARIDMHRGVAKDDRGNVEWHKNWLHHMPRYRARLAKTHGPQSTNSCANAVEVAAGLSYAAFKNNSNLPSDQTIEFPSEEAHNAWVKVWHVFGELGLTVFGQLAHTVSANGPPPVEAACCGGAAQPAFDAAELQAPSGNAPQQGASTHRPQGLTLLDVGSDEHTEARDALQFVAAQALATQLREFWNNREEQLPQQANALRALLFAKTKHPIPEDLWILGAAQPEEAQHVTAVVSENYVLQQLKAVIELRERWLVSENLPLNFQMRDKKERPRFLEWARKLYQAETLQVELETEELRIGGKKRRHDGRRKRWCRELQRRLGTANLWLSVSFTGRCDLEMVRAAGAPNPEEKRTDPQREAVKQARWDRAMLRWGDHLSRRRAAGHRKFSHQNKRTLEQYDAGRLFKWANESTLASGFGRIKRKDGSYVDIGRNAGGLTRTILDDYVPPVIEDSDNTDEDG